MKRLMLFLLLIAAIFLLTGCNVATTNKRITTAKIRYFDGSMDTFEVERWRTSPSGTITLYTMEGRTVVIGVNNVILIDETKEQYEH